MTLIPHFTLSAFGDEIDNDLQNQLSLLASEDIHSLELRSAWGQNVLDLDSDALHRAKTILRDNGFTVSAIGSPIGKSSLDHPASWELERLERAITAAETLDTRLIRIFSFFVPDGQAQTVRDEVIERMGLLTERAAQVGVRLVHENEKGIYGDTAERCQDLLMTINSPALRMAFDPANFVQVGVRPMEDAWPLLQDYTTHIHIKDAIFSGASVRPAGKGDGAIPELLAALIARGYQGYLTLEPHLQIAGPSGGFSGEAGMRTAIHALRELLATFTDQQVRIA